MEKLKENDFGIIYHPLFGEINKLDQPRPFFESYEDPLRVKLIWQYLKLKNIVVADFKEIEGSEEEDVIINQKLGVIAKRPRPLKEEDLYRVHSRYHVELVKTISQNGGGQLGNLVMATPDTYELALLSAGGAYDLLKNIFLEKFRAGIALIRPPGHHATYETSEGLCVFNNIALAIRKLRDVYNFKENIAIIDIDAHYGDGLAKIFYEDPSVLYTSIHEYDFDTGESGFWTEIGAKDGKGTNINYPIPLESDGAFLKSYLSFIEKYIIDFHPAIIIVALGFDGFWADPLGNLAYTMSDYQFFSNWLKQLSLKVCNQKVAFILEGGYNLLALPYLTEKIITPFIYTTSSSSQTFASLINQNNLNSPLFIDSFFENTLDENTQMEYIENINVSKDKGKHGIFEKEKEQIPSFLNYELNYIRKHVQDLTKTLDALKDLKKHKEKK
ncbi:MAG: histone deacetylase family protein [Promethearchaeota archaeon]